MTVDVEGARAGQYGDVQARLERAKEIRALYLVSMTEAVDSTLDGRAYDITRTYPALITAGTANASRLFSPSDSGSGPSATGNRRSSSVLSALHRNPTVASSETSHPESNPRGWLGMMNNMTLLNRSGLAAIAAATVLLSTPALAQDAAPVTADPAPIVADTPLPDEPTAAPEVVSDPLAPAATTTTTTTRTTRTTRPTRASVAPATRSVRAPAAPTIAPNTSAAPTAPAVEVAPSFDPAMVAPLPEPVAAAPVAAADSTTIEDVLPVAGAAGLGLLALAGAGFAMRRRRRDDEVVVEATFREPVISRAEPVPVATPIAVAAPLAAKPAFNWGNAPRESAPSKSWIDAARRGPTPDNPSQSLKKRLQRASFFDQRERAVAAGKAVPVSPMAGLPEALARPPVAAAKPVRIPDQGVRMSFGRTFQPA